MTYYFLRQFNIKLVLRFRFDFFIVNILKIKQNDLKFLVFTVPNPTKF